MSNTRPTFQKLLLRLALIREDLRKNETTDEILGTRSNSIDGVYRDKHVVSEISECFTNMIFLRKKTFSTIFNLVT